MIKQLQKEVLKCPQSDIETTHTFCNGVYAREIKIPKGVVLVGAKHKTAFFMVISSGICSINGVEYKAPQTLISEIGEKRAIYAMEETIIVGFHPTNKTNIKEIELDIIEDEGLKIANNPEVLICGS